MKKTVKKTVNQVKSDFYERMLEAKRRKKEALEKAQLHAEFEAHPERFTAPQPVVVKTDAELRLDAAFAELQAKLRANAPQDPLKQTLDRLRDAANKLPE